jgi:hypothetical protein
VTWDRRQATDGYCSARRIDDELEPVELTPAEKAYGLLEKVQARNWTQLADLTDEQDVLDAEYRERAT